MSKNQATEPAIVQTWGDFKRAVENSGVLDTDEVGYIDMSGGNAIRVDRYRNAENVAWRFSAE